MITERRSRPPVASQHEALADSSVFAETVQVRLEAMTRLAARLAPNESPDDVVQEALIRAWRYRESYDAGRGTFWTWLMGIVAHEARRAASHRRKPPAYQAALETVPIEEREDIGAAVRRLPPRQRLAIDCYYYADLSILRDRGRDEVH
jgi:RNA polymerase sigma-70 factor (ECF subfamily)